MENVVYNHEWTGSSQAPLLFLPKQNVIVLIHHSMSGVLHILLYLSGVLRFSIGHI